MLRLNLALVKLFRNYGNPESRFQRETLNP